MRFNITARRFKLSNELKEFTQSEVLRLKKYYNGIIDTEVILGWEKKARVAEVKIAVFGTMLTAKEHSEDMKSSIRQAVDKLERQLIKYKDKLRGFERDKAVDQNEPLENVNMTKENW